MSAGPVTSRKYSASGTGSRSGWPSSVTGEIWEHENGPADGDEINIVKAGLNYGWPLVGYGRDYSGDFIGGIGAIGEVGRRDACRVMTLAGMEPPVSFWAPAVAPSGMAFYTGDRFPAWKGHLFVGVMKNQRVEKYSFDDKGQIRVRNGCSTISSSGSATSARSRTGSSMS